MNQAFPAQFFSGNRTKLKSELDSSAPIVLFANGLLQRGGDSSYPFHQDASFWYFTGCNEPDLVLVCDQHEDYLIVPIREGSRAAFDGVIDEQKLSQISGIKLILHEHEGWKKLNDELAKSKQVSTVAAPPDYIEQLGMYTNPARARLINELQTHHPKLKMVDIAKDIARQRVIKQPMEIATIQKAIDITISSLDRALKPEKLKTYEYEYQIEAELNYDFRRLGAQGHAFAPIIAGGANACTLHNIANDDLLKKNQLVLCDVGAEYNHYAADITRTVSPVSPSSRQEAVYASVLETQDYALGLLRPGTLLKRYETMVEQFLAKKLRSLGLISSSDHKQVRKYMPHATSHFLGLNAHDVGLYDQPLEAGMVLTAEPGIYVPEESLGIRIEDDVLITENGNKVLSGKLARSLSQ